MSGIIKSESFPSCSFGIFGLLLEELRKDPFCQLGSMFGDFEPPTSARNKRHVFRPRFSVEPRLLQIFVGSVRSTHAKTHEFPSNYVGSKDALSIESFSIRDYTGSSIQNGWAGLGRWTTVQPVRLAPVQVQWLRVLGR